MTAKYTDDLMNLLEKASNDYGDYLPKLENEIADKVEDMMSGMERDRNTGIIKPTEANFKKLAAIKSGFDTILNDTSYGKVSAQYLSAYTTITNITNGYFNSLATDFTPSKAMEAVKQAAIDSTIDNLSKKSLLSNLRPTLKNPVIQSITTSISKGTPYQQAIKQLRTITTGGDGTGPIERFAKPLAMDGLNRYAANYIDVGSLGLGLNWFMDVGPVIKNTRCWCKGVLKIKYVHRSEFQRLIDMDFPEFEDCEVYSKTDLPDGMIEGTNPSNLIELRGGYGPCNHQFIPVPDDYVPIEERMRLAA